MQYNSYQLAEIIGVKPNPLAKDLYKYLITNSIWAKQRSQFGYKYIKNTPFLKTSIICDN